MLPTIAEVDKANDVGTLHVITPCWCGAQNLSSYINSLFNVLLGFYIFYSQFDFYFWYSRSFEQKCLIKLPQLSGNLCWTQRPFSPISTTEIMIIYSVPIHVSRSQSILSFDKSFPLRVPRIGSKHFLKCLLQASHVNLTLSFMSQLSIIGSSQNF